MAKPGKMVTSQVIEEFNEGAYKKGILRLEAARLAINTHEKLGGSLMQRCKQFADFLLEGKAEELKP